MQNDPNRINVTAEGANLLSAFMIAHQRVLDNPEPGQYNLDEMSVLSGDGRVVSVIMQRGEADANFRVTTTSLSDLNAGQEPKVKTEPYGLQMRDGYMRVKTDLGTLKYNTYGKKAEILPTDGEEPIPVVAISRLLEEHDQKMTATTTARAEGLESADSALRAKNVSIGGIRRLLRRR